MILFPKPRYQDLYLSKKAKPRCFSFQIDKNLQKEILEVGFDFNYVSNFSGTGEPILIIGNKNNSFSIEEFKLTIKDAIEIEYNTSAGFYYAMDTLHQILQHKGWYNGEIQDKPAMEIRGALIDIGRDKIPTLATLYEYIDLFARLRYNHLELYMEGYAYKYEKYQYLFAENSAITGDEFIALSSYAKKKNIDLVPNQNCLGHMDQWLAKPPLKDLAECPEGFLHQNLYWRAPMTLDVKNEKAFELVEYLVSELANKSESKYFNVNLDEPFELGRGKNKEFAEKHGVEKLYLDYVHKLHSFCAENGKKMMMWGDVVFNHPEILDQFPKDVILLDWIYEGDADFESHCKALSDVGCEWCLCPGTNSWATFAGRSDNTVKNINNAVYNTVKYNGKGVIITDWGDLGHWQYFSVSIPPFVCAGQAMWQGSDIDIDAVRFFCNKYIFNDTNNKMFDILYNLGNYYLLEKSPLYNTTLSFSLMSSKYIFSNKEEFDSEVQRLLALCKNIATENNITITHEKIDPDYDKIYQLLNKTLEELEDVCLCGADKDVILQEVKCTIAFIWHGLTLYRIMSQEENEKYRLLMREQYEHLSELLPKHYNVWMKRNRPGGFVKSSSHILKLIEFYSNEMK